MDFTLTRRGWFDPAAAAEQLAGPLPARRLTPLLVPATLGGLGWTAGAAVGSPHLLAAAAAGLVAPTLLWAAGLPTLFVVGCQLGSALRLRQVLAVSLVALSFGGLALGAALPIAWFLRLALPWPQAAIGVHAALVAAAALASLDVLARALDAVEPASPARGLWFALFALTWVQVGLLTAP